MSYEQALDILYSLFEQAEITKDAYEYYLAEINLFNECPDETCYVSFNDIINEAEEA